VCGNNLQRLWVTRDGQTGRPARTGPGKAQPVLGPACQARLENRAGLPKPAGSISCPSPAHKGPKRAGSARLSRKKRVKRVGKHVLVQKAGLTGLEVNVGDLFSNAKS
jgi:hypothetical protein